MATFPWWLRVAAKTVVLLFGVGGVVVFWILTDMARDPQVGGSVPILLGFTGFFVVVGLVGLVAVVAEVRQLLSESPAA